MGLPIPSILCGTLLLTLFYDWGWGAPYPPPPPQIAYSTLTIQT